jgi:hypothetical protein
MMALDVLMSAVPPEMVATVASKDTMKEAWDATKTMWIGNGRVRASMVQQLLQQFDATTFGEEESVKDFLMWLSNMAQHLATLNEPLDEPSGKILAQCSEAL